MSHENEFWKLEQLSDGQLLESLGAVLRIKRRALADVVAHLAELEERRLHLLAAHSSLFAYCVCRLGMSEDEACRRIELARLARKFPALFPELASGQISLSVALLLKPVLSSGNQLELLAEVRGKSMQQARELVAARFPRPDVTSSIRKLPDRQPLRAPERAELFGRPLPSASSPSLPEPSAASVPDALLPQLSIGSTAASAASEPSVPPPSSPSPVLQPSLLTPSAPTPTRPAASLPAATTARPLPSSRSRSEPLSAQRYKIQFTADAELKGKLELARDLLRHAHPSGDFAPILARGLDLLIADLLKRRFGLGAKRSRSDAPPVKPAAPLIRSSTAAARHCRSSTTPASPTSLDLSTTAVPAPVVPTPAAAFTAPSCSAPSCSVLPATPSRGAAGSCIRRAARRAVLERDGLECGWVDADGMRCGARAWLELDHRHPRGQGGGSEPDNLRLLCRAHNRLAAEQAYGQEHIEHATLAHRRQREPSHPLRS